MNTTDELSKAETWAAMINARTVRTVESIIEIGRTFIEAKQALAHGEFLRMFGERLVRFKPRSAQALMSIAKKAWFANAQYIAYLPPAWSVLAELVLIPDQTLLEGIASGRLNPAIEFRQVTAWRRELGVKRTAALDRPGRLPKQRRSAATQPERMKKLYTKQEQAARLEQIRELADEGARSDQIGIALGMRGGFVRELMKKAGIECPGDKFGGRCRTLDQNRILEHIVLTAEDLEDSERQLDVTGLELHTFEHAITALLNARQVIGRLVGRLKTEKERQLYEPKKADTTNIESTSSADQSDGSSASVHQSASVHTVAR